jgi:hypothetical protein
LQAGGGSGAGVKTFSLLPSDPRTDRQLFTAFAFCLEDRLQAAYRFTLRGISLDEACSRSRLLQDLATFCGCSASVSLLSVNLSR